MEHREIIVALVRWVPVVLGLIGLGLGIAGLVGSELRAKRREKREAMLKANLESAEKWNAAKRKLWEETSPAEREVIEKWDAKFEEMRKEFEREEASTADKEDRKNGC